MRICRVAAWTTYVHIDRAARRRLSEAENAGDVRRGAILYSESIERPSDAKITGDASWIWINFGCATCLRSPWAMSLISAYAVCNNDVFKYENRFHRVTLSKYTNFALFGVHIKYTFRSRPKLHSTIMLMKISMRGNRENIDIFSLTFISGSGEHSKVYSAKIRRNKSAVPAARTSRTGKDRK